jgi:hypothetical protein
MVIVKVKQICTGGLDNTQKLTETYFVLDFIQQLLFKSLKTFTDH